MLLKSAKSCGARLKMVNVRLDSVGKHLREFEKG